MVALDPQTGEVLAMVSVPTYDPNEVASSQGFQALNQDPDAPLFNRATQAGYPPGSTMKVVTATAALDSGEFEVDDTVSGESGKVISGVPLENAGGESFGEIPLTTALTNSVNTVWAEVAEDLGTETMYEYMDRFGFNAKPPLDYPSFQLAPSGEFADGKLLDAGSDQIDVGRMAIGQDKLNVTPLQMAMVAAAVANEGELMEPRLWSKVIDTDGREEKLNPERMSRVMDEETAEELTGMMEDVVNEGTGGAAALGERPGGRQDGDRGDHPRAEREPGLVHRLRALGRPQGRDRGHRGAHQRLRRHRGGADRPAGAGGAGGEHQWRG